MNRGTLLRLGLAIVALTIISSIVMLIPEWQGVQASAEADDIDTLLDVMIVLSCFVFSIVMVGLIYAIWKFRAKPGDESDGEPIHGNTKLEIAWTAIPTIVVLFGAAYSWIVLNDIESEAAAGDQVQVEVTGQQYAWTFEYPDEGVTSQELHVPVDTQLELQLRALDVIHSFWVPEWRIKRDVVPVAEDNPTEVDDTVRVTPTREGTYQLVCTEYCGWGHATMRAPVVVEPEEDFEQWLAEQRAEQGGEGGGGGAPDDAGGEGGGQGA